MRADATLALLLVMSGCAVNLSPDSDSSASSAVPAPALSGCLPFADRASALNGRVSQVTLPDQRALVIADSVTLDGETSTLGFSGGDAACFAGSSPLPARPIVDVTALGTSTRGRPLASVTSATDTFLYFAADHTDGLASDGVGVARWDAATEQFVSLALLWTADRPSYGSAAAVVGDEVYVLGGLAARFLAADVYLARVPTAQIADSNAYEYWQGGGNFGRAADSALPLVEGGTAPSVAFDATRERWLMLYATPLASDVTARSGLGITGPWSRPYTLGRCDLPAADPSSFCGDVSLVPGLVENGGIAFTQTVSTFQRPAQSTDRDFWTRLIRAPWPTELP